MKTEKKRCGECVECGHSKGVDPRGRCLETQREPGGSMVYCGCKCVFPATEAPTVAFMAYNQAVNDAKAAIRGEKVDDPYTAATFISAIARKCSPHRYVAQVSDAPADEIIAAIADMQGGRDSHQQWLDHLSNSEREDCKGCDGHAAHIGDVEHHRQWIEKYDRVIRLLAEVPGVATTGAGAGTERQLPTVADLLGSDPDFTGDETTDEYMRRIRGRAPATVAKEIGFADVFGPAPAPVQPAAAGQDELDAVTQQLRTSVNFFNRYMKTGDDLCSMVGGGVTIRVTKHGPGTPTTGAGARPVHPFGPCGYKYCDWPDGELRCNEPRHCPPTEAAQVVVVAPTYAHMCCDGHHEIGFNDPDDEYSERCPLCSEVDRLVDGVRDHLISLGVPDSRIDGAGCDSGDPLDFTTAEITQAFSYIEDQNVAKLTTARADAIRDAVERLRAARITGFNGVGSETMKEACVAALESLTTKEGDDGPTAEGARIT